MPIDSDVKNGLTGVFGPAPDTSGASDVFGVLGDILSGAKDAVGNVFDVIGSYEQRQIERMRIKADALRQGTVTSSTKPIYRYQTGAPVDYQKWGLIIGVVGLFLAIFVAFKD